MPVFAGGAGAVAAINLGTQVWGICSGTKSLCRAAGPAAGKAAFGYPGACRVALLTQSYGGPSEPDVVRGA